MEGWSCSRTNSHTQGALFSLANHMLGVNKYFYVVQEWDDNPVHMSFLKSLLHEKPSGLYEENLYQI